MNHRLLTGAFGLALIALIAGCGPTFGPQAQNGITFFCPGAGNIDFGDQGVRDGLRGAGYRGQVATYVWTISFNPAIDQSLRLNARLRASGLADHIKQYIDKFPGTPVNLIGLSAGTGVVIWALEDLKPAYKVDNVVLLASSLHHKYDVGKALRRVKGNIYNYYSPNDPILGGPMKVFGTIDGVFFEDGAGAVGLHSPSGSGRVVNIAWRPEFSKYGYSGGLHTDVTSSAFVRAEISQHIIGASATGRRETAPATALATRHPDGRPD